MLPRLPRFRRIDAPFYFLVACALALTLAAHDRQWLHETILSSRWSLAYLALAPLVHGGLGHLLLNVLAFYFIGIQMLRPLIGNKALFALFFGAVAVGHLANNLLGSAPAVGISGGVMGLLAASLYRYKRAPMKILLLHDVFRRLPPFSLRSLAVTIVALDLLGIVFNWMFFAHWAHLGGFATGLIWGRYRFGGNPFSLRTP